MPEIELCVECGAPDNYTELMRDAARYRYLRRTTTVVRNSKDERVEVTPELMDSVIDENIAATSGVAPPAEPLRHAAKDNGDCPHWCRACAVERAARGVSASDAALVREAIRFGQFADDANWQLAKPIRDAIKRLFPVDADGVPVPRREDQA